jgi:cysteine desulfurase/selenocysteine lyase
LKTDSLKKGVYMCKWLFIALMPLYLSISLSALASKKDFPIWSYKENKNLIYFDNGATSQKPKAVINQLLFMYKRCCANVHRGNSRLSQEATEQYEDARKQIAHFINADEKEVIFTKGATESINFVAATWAEQFLQPGDHILISELEHNSNVLPWFNLAQKKNVVIDVMKVGPDGSLIVDESLLTPQTKLVAITRTSNAIGTNTPIEIIIQMAHSHGARVLVDGCQSVPYEKTDVKAMDADFLVFSGHKMLGPNGIGVLYMKKELLDATQPYQWGGGMVDLVKDLSTVILNPSPEKFEAGTPPIAEAIGLAAATEYLEKIDPEVLRKHLAHLCEIMIDQLEQIPHVTIYGPKEQLKHEGHVVAFNVYKIIPWRVAEYLDQHNIAVRASKHCAHLLAKALGYAASIRASFYLYNTEDEVKRFVEVIKKYMNEEYEKDVNNPDYAIPENDTACSAKTRLACGAA